MKNFKQIENYPIYNLYSVLNDMIDKNILSWKNGNQICLNTTPDNPDDPLFGVGSLDLDWKNIYKVDGKTIVPPRAVPLREDEFTDLCSQFKGTVFEEIYNFLQTKYIVGRVRLMRSTFGSCMSWHYDYSPRLHYPIKTQEGCFMVIDDEIKHMPENTWWWTDTTKYHTAFNSSKDTRIHLVVCIVERNNE